MSYFMIIILLSWLYKSKVEIGLYVALYVFCVLILIDASEDVAMNDIVYLFPELRITMRLK